MRLPEDDENYLNEKGFDWELQPDGQWGILVIKGYPISGVKYDRKNTDLMIRIPPQYNNAALDMFYADPPVQLKNGGFPNRADQFENHGGHRWQRFSRHLSKPWRPGIDSLPGFLSLISREIQSDD